MAVIEMRTFRLAESASEADFLAADRRVQTEFAYHQPGLARRTTARGEDGEWVVISVWATEADANAAGEQWPRDPRATALMELIDGSTVRTTRYQTLD